MNNTTKTLIEYCQRNDLCRRNFLFCNFECYKPSPVKIYVIAVMCVLNLVYVLNVLINNYFH